MYLYNVKVPIDECGILRFLFGLLIYLKSRDINIIKIDISKR